MERGSKLFGVWSWNYTFSHIHQLLFYCFFKRTDWVLPPSNCITVPGWSMLLLLTETFPLWGFPEEADTFIRGLICKRLPEQKLKSSLYTLVICCLLYMSVFTQVQDNSHHLPHITIIIIIRSRRSPFRTHYTVAPTVESWSHNTFQGSYVSYYIITVTHNAHRREGHPNLYRWAARSARRKLCNAVVFPHRHAAGNGSADFESSKKWGPSKMSMWFGVSAPPFRAASQLYAQKRAFPYSALSSGATWNISALQMLGS